MVDAGGTCHNSGSTYGQTIYLMTDSSTLYVDKQPGAVKNLTHATYGRGAPYLPCKIPDLSSYIAPLGGTLITLDAQSTLPGVGITTILHELEDNRTKLRLIRSVVM